MEYIKFQKSVSVGDILDIIKDLSIEYGGDIDRNLLLYGVSNGLYQIDKTLCFIENIKSIEQIESMSNALIITNSQFTGEMDGYHLLSVKDARYTFIKLLSYFQKDIYLEFFSSFVEIPKHCISPQSDIHPSAIVEEHVVIQEGVQIGAGCVIKNGTYIDKNTIIRENSTIGCDGIALYKAKNSEVLRFPHFGGVYIGKEVEIGASCVIVQGTLASTKIMDNSVIGNLSNIGHGVEIGQKVWLSVGGMIGGNCKIGEGVTMGLSVSLKDNLTIADGCTIGMGSVVTKSLPNKMTVFGNPAKAIRPLNVGPKR